MGQFDAATNSTAATNMQDLLLHEETFVPSDTELTLLCLDHLRAVLRSSSLSSTSKKHPTTDVSGLDADYIAVACWALSRSFTVAPLADGNNDAFFDATTAAATAKLTSRKNGGGTSKMKNHKKVSMEIPSLDEMKQELLHNHNTGEHVDFDVGTSTEKNDASEWQSLYPYDDGHASNGHRFYVAGGLAGTPASEPLQLGEVVTAGLVALQARSRLAAERDLIRTPLFEQYLSAVRLKGFFSDDNSNSDTREDDDVVYEERFRKVVAKFRHKLSAKTTDTSATATADLMAYYSVASLYRQQQRNVTAQQRQQQPDVHDEQQQTVYIADLPIPAAYSVVRKHNPDHIHTTNSRLLLSPTLSAVGSRMLEPSESTLSILSSSQLQHHPADLREAEKLKNLGNTHMQRKEYQQAADCYTSALKLSPAGPNSHVYFSNRAAAAVSMKQFQQAITDSERSLALKPDYSKAHARLGLAHFLAGNYRAAVEAYTVAIKYEPDNQSSRNYLEKSAKRLAEAGETTVAAASTSYSVVSEVEKNRQVAVDEKEAEKYKVKGNSLMANRDYQAALDAYSKAIQLNPAGPLSHVYYSNRAAALCYLERYADAESDSMRSLELHPTYGKAYARLGLSRFFLHDYAGAVSAYEKALEYDPDNAASKSYLVKAQAKLAAASGIV